MTRSRLVLVIALLGAAAFVFALVLVHGAGHQTLQGTKTDPANPDAPGEPTKIRVKCASPASGPLLTDDGGQKGPEQLEGDDNLAEDDQYVLSQQGIDIDEVIETCGRVRTERLTHAVELAFLGLLLGGAAVAVSRGRTWDPIDRTPGPGRRDDGAVL
ncbi:hypothetical protein [Nocardioides plantarum]|uniref:Aromatic ring-opening dioxygenase LigA n=1 Tax=Nocardioides plantarum TaxID=29299 RepID=A0ABV5KFY6_9ACTN|nr:hypothetical protein [Nocardioides plantarum]